MKSICLAVLAVTVGWGALAQTAPPPNAWVTDSRTGCKIATMGSGKNTVSWSGGCVEGLADGRGALRWSGENNLVDQYEGEMRRGRKNGRGTFIWISGSRYAGDRYDGQFVDDMFHGRGVYLWKSGNRYEGEWRNNDFNGQGVMQWANGDRYTGQWQNDKAHGQGTKTAADGRSWSGTWNNGCFRQGDKWSTVGTTAEKCGFK